jgi:hypothetical protein
VWLLLFIGLFVCIGGGLVARSWYVASGWQPFQQPTTTISSHSPVEVDRSLSRVEPDVFSSPQSDPLPVITPTAPSADPTAASSVQDQAVVESPMPTKTMTSSPTPSPTPTSTSTATITPTPNPGPETVVIGYSVRNTPLEAVRFGNGQDVIIFVGGLHSGFVPGSVTLANRTIEHFQQNPGDIPASVTVYILPNVNPDSPYDPGELGGRLNANGVDLNRNWDCRWTADPRWRNVVQRGMGGSAPLSEPETQALAAFILSQNSQAVIFWQAMVTNGLVSPGSCGTRSQSSEALARIYGLAAGYRIADFEQLTNQAINGDVTNWLDSQGIAAVSILLPNYTNADWNNNLAGIRAVLRAYE